MSVAIKTLRVMQMTTSVAHFVGRFRVDVKKKNRERELTEEKKRSNVRRRIDIAFFAASTQWIYPLF